MTHFVSKLMIDDLEHRLCIEEIAHNSVLCMCMMSAIYYSRGSI